MQNEPQASEPRRKRRLARYGLLLVVAGCAYGAWREFTFRKAVREITAAGFHWKYDDPIEIIRNDWSAIFRKNTWTIETRHLLISDTSWASVAEHRKAIERLEPNSLVIWKCTGPGRMDAIRNVESIRVLGLSFCAGLESIAGIEGLVHLEQFNLLANGALANVDALKSLPKLKTIKVTACPGLTREAIAALENALPHTNIDHDFERSFGPEVRMVIP